MNLLKTVFLSATILVVLAEDKNNATRSKRQQIAFYPRHGGRPPPYAVQMEPIVHYSQRHPLYNPAASSKSDDHAYYDDDNLYNHYSNEPEPIIEIIIKESNETLPTPVPPTPAPQPRPTKEPIQVFYVKYEKKKGYGDTKPRVVYDPPIPALNPVEEHEVIKPEETDEPREQAESVVRTTEPTTTEPTTTLRAIIRPESEIYHSGSSGIRVTFGTDQVPPNHHNKRSDSTLPPSAPSHPVRTVTPLPSLDSPKRQHGPYNPLQPVHTRLPPAFPQQRIVNSFPPQQQPFPPNYPGTHPHFQPGPNGPRPSQRPPITVQGLPELQQRLPFQNFGTPHRISINHPQQPGFPNTVSVSHQSVHIQNQPPSVLPAGNFNANLQQHPHPQQPYEAHEAHQAQQQRQGQHPHQVQQSHQAQAHRAQQQHQSQYQQQAQQPGQQPPHQPLQTHAQPHAQSYKQQQQELEKQRYHQEQRRQQELRYREQQRQQEQQQQLEQQRQQDHQRKVEQRRLLEQQRQQERRRQEEQQRIQEQQRYNLEQQQRREQEQENKLLQEQQYRQQINFGQPGTIGNQQLRESPPQSKPGSEILKAVPKLEQHYAIRENPLHPGPFPPNPQIQTARYPEAEKNAYSQKASPPPEDLPQQHYLSRNPTSVPSIATSQQQHQQQLQGSNGVPKQTPYRNDEQSFFAQNLPTPQQRIQASPQPSLWDGRPVFQDRGRDKIYATPAISNINDPGPSAALETVFANDFNETRLPATTTTTTPKTPAPPTRTPGSTTLVPKNEARIKENIANLPDEVPEDIREQLLSSGILGNADIQVLDYDKVGGIPIESLPPEALANFYGAGGAAATAASEPVPSIVERPKNVSANGREYTKKKSTFTKVEHATLKPGGVQMKVVHFDPNTAQGQAIADQHIREDATHLQPVSIDTKISEKQQYNRYLPLKVSGASFPIPDVPELRGRRISSVVVLAPVDYSDFRDNSVPTDKGGVDDDKRQSRMHNGAQSVKFLAGDSLKRLVKKPNVENYTKWLEQERHTEPQRQSVVLLVTTLEDDSHGDKEIFMYDVSSQLVSKLSGDLSSAFVNAAESNSDSSGNIDDSTFDTY